MRMNKPDTRIKISGMVTTVSQEIAKSYKFPCKVCSDPQKLYQTLLYAGIGKVGKLHQHG